MQESVGLRQEQCQFSERDQFLQVCKCVSHKQHLRAVNFKESSKNLWSRDAPWKDLNRFLVLAIGKALVFHKGAEERRTASGPETWQGPKCCLLGLPIGGAMHLATRLCHTQAWLCLGTGAQRGHHSWGGVRRE